MLSEPLLPSLRGGTESAGSTAVAGTQHLIHTPAQATAPAADPYLYLLVAMQELQDGRDDQAEYLIEAAYELFDQKAGAEGPGFHFDF